ncbi:hypothetical protein ROHU_002701 [Labeo rohita]|uniref:Uncharacterized protein n=1 Tax=Labeo rohita TaxID=84645 RepID=A0A498NY79_LABRO|nr:hypothetical protein ROHU_002701 [Labeo rohita]
MVSAQQNAFSILGIDHTYYYYRTCISFFPNSITTNNKGNIFNTNFFYKCNNNRAKNFFPNSITTNNKGNIFNTNFFYKCNNNRAKK